MHHGEDEQAMSIFKNMNLQWYIYWNVGLFKIVLCFFLWVLIRCKGRSMSSVTIGYCFLYIKGLRFVCWLLCTRLM
jgi:hypothetical protein